MANLITQQCTSSQDILILFASSLLIAMLQTQFFVWHFNSKQLTFPFEAGFHKVAGQP